MPSHQMLGQVIIFEIQATLAVVIGVPVLTWLVRLPGNVVRYRRLLADLERTVPAGTPFVVRWDQHRRHHKGVIQSDAAIAGTIAALVLSLIVVLHGAFPGWLLAVWAVSAIVALLGSLVAAYFQRRLRKATGVLVDGYRAVSKAAHNPAAHNPTVHNSTVHNSTAHDSTGGGLVGQHTAESESAGS